MSGAVVEFRRAHPGMGLEFRTETSGRRCFDALAAHGPDLARVTVGAPVRGIEQRPVAAMPWVLAVRPGDPLADRAAVTPDDLAQVEHIRLPENSASRAHLDAAFARSGVRVTSDSGTADWDTVLLLAELGVGRAVVPALPGWDGPARPGLRLVPIPALPPLSVSWAVPRWDALSPQTRVFADTVARDCGERGSGAVGKSGGRGDGP